jgi:predicted DNA-binding mobile mystery protein A
MPTQNRTPARRQLDRRFTQLRPLTQEPRPHQGWIKAIREALGMSSTELAARMGVVHQAIREFENSEVKETIKLETLRRIGEALDCQVVYALVPRTSLEEAVKSQSIRKATNQLVRVSHHSRLEDQAVGVADEAVQIEDLAKQLIDRRGLWTVADDFK